jgi:hypothetical protein
MMHTFWNSPWSRVLGLVLGALAWHGALGAKAWWKKRKRQQARFAAERAEEKSITADYRSAAKEDPEAPPPPPSPASATMLSQTPTDEEAWVVDMLKTCVRDFADHKPAGFASARGGISFTITYNPQLELFVYKTHGHKPITSPNFVAFLRRIRAFEADVLFAKKK